MLWSTQHVSITRPVTFTSVTLTQIMMGKLTLPLPAVGDNEPGSHGYIAFKIKPATSVGLEDVIENTANIYFDFNFPIVTNTVSTTVTALGIAENEVSDSVKIYPNPANNSLSISLNQNDAIKLVTINNMIGQKVKVISADIDLSKIDISTLSAGTYFIKVETNNGEITKKLIKR